MPCVRSSPVVSGKPTAYADSKLEQCAANVEALEFTAIAITVLKRMFAIECQIKALSESIFAFGSLITTTSIR